MKAIDFACRLLASLSKESHSLTMQSVLLGLAAGLETSEDISACLNISRSTCTMSLQRLKDEDLVTDIRGYQVYYRLTPQGKALVAKILSFMPSPR